MNKDQSTPARQDVARIPDGSDHRQHAALDRVVTRAHELKDKQRSNLRESLRTAVRLCSGPGCCSSRLLGLLDGYDRILMRRGMS